MSNTVYWVWLQRAVGKGAHIGRILEPFGGSPKRLYEADAATRRWLLRGDASLFEGGIPGTPEFYEDQLRKSSPRALVQRKASSYKPTENQIGRMEKVTLTEAEEVLENCDRAGIQVLAPDDDCYPWLLREIPSFPAALYTLGDSSLLAAPSIPFAMVGARDARLNSLSAAADLAGTLAKSGLLVVSGGAMGTDAACHIGALNAGCPTVAVLGTGIGTRYLQQNADLRRVISENGVLVSEMEPGEPGSKGSFPLRNRIIAGMSIGTLVVEAAVKSGSLITTKFAEDFGRDVFVPLFPAIDPTGELTALFPSYLTPVPDSLPLLETPKLPNSMSQQAEQVPSYEFKVEPSEHFETNAVPGISQEIEDPAKTNPFATNLDLQNVTDLQTNVDPIFSEQNHISPKGSVSAAFQGTRELLERETGIGIRCAADVLAACGESYGLSPEELVSSGAVSEADLLRDITDPSGLPLPLLSPAMVAHARRQLGVVSAAAEPRDLPGGSLNPDPGWGPYRTRADASGGAYTAAEFAHRQPSAARRSTSAPAPAAPDSAAPAPVATAYAVQPHLISGPATPAPVFTIPPHSNPDSTGLAQANPDPGDAKHTIGGETGEKQTVQPNFAEVNSPNSTTTPAFNIPSSKQSNTNTIRNSNQTTPVSTKELLPPGEYEKLSTAARRIVACYRKAPGKPLYFDDFANTLDMSAQQLLAAMTELQLAGHLDTLPDGTYVVT